MASTLSKKLPDMPKGNWKAGLMFSPKTTTKEKPKAEIKKSPLKPSQKPIKKTPIKQIGARKKARISQYGTESDFFHRVWIDRGGDKKIVKCAFCTLPVERPFMKDSRTEKMKLVKPQCFAHILAKGMYEKFRYLPENIAIVCSTTCHHSIDEQYTDGGVRKELEDKFDTLISQVGTTE